jgi:hypothetical protein
MVSVTDLGLAGQRLDEDLHFTQRCWVDFRRRNQVALSNVANHIQATRRQELLSATLPRKRAARADAPSGPAPRWKPATPTLSQ